MNAGVPNEEAWAVFMGQALAAVGSSKELSVDFAARRAAQLADLALIEFRNRYPISGK